MAFSPTGPLYAGSASAGGDWSNVSNATGVEDGNNAQNLNEGPGGGGHVPSQLVTSSHGFALPTNAIIDGIKLEANVSSGGSSADQQIQVGTPGKLSASTPGFHGWPATPAFLTWGGPTALWGRTDWTAADINSSSFGASLSAYATSGTDNIFIDAVRITVYWHNAPHVIPKQKYYIYKVYDSQTGNYLGNLPNVSSEFALSQDINTAGAQINVKCAISADTSSLPVDVLTDEAGTILTDESNRILTDEGIAPQTGIGTGGALIRDGNKVQVWEYSYYHVNGICMFRGIIERHEDSFGGDTGDNSVTILLYSDSSDLDNHLVKAGASSYTLDQSQTSYNTRDSLIQVGGPGVSWNFDGQTITVGAGITNLGAISLLLDGIANVTVTVYDSPALINMLATVTQGVSVVGPTEIRFTFPLHIPVTAGNQYFFTVSVDAGQSIWLEYQNTNVYSGGAMYNSNYGGAGGGSYLQQPSYDLWFKTWSTTGATTATFTAIDPSTGMLETILNDYKIEGGTITYDSTTIQATGLTLNYGFNTNTVYDAIRGALTVSPNGFYYYVDLGTNLLYFKRANTIADVVFTKGVHISKLNVVSTIEYVINACYVVGADVSGSNIYTLDMDFASINLYGLRLQVHTDPNIPNITTAHAVGSSIVAANKDERYQSVVAIVDRTMDITALIPGKIVGFNGFGTYVDGLLAQIVHRDYTPDQVTLTLGLLPKRTTNDVEQVTRGLVALNTVTNPTAPS